MKICLIGNTHPSHNPRLIREADTLSNIGHDVFVVSPSYIPKLVIRDKELLETRNWKFIKCDFSPIGYLNKIKNIKFRTVRKIYKKLFEKYSKIRFAEKCFIFAFDELLELSIGIKADWYIAHTQGALPIAAKAASYNNSKLGFDCEDLLSENGIDPPDIVNKIEEEYIKKCQYISTPSKEISKFLAEKYSLIDPTELYNVFPLNLASGMREPKNRPNNKIIKVHWMSQVIGPHRGIQLAIQAISEAGGGFDLYLRGSIDSVFKNELTDFAQNNNVKVYFLPQIKHDDVIKSMENYDIGLATETGLDSNFSKTITNKIFSYMLAGLAVIATKTPGQLEVLNDNIECSYLYEPGNLEELVRIFKRIREFPDQLVDFKQNSWELARSKYCWEVEKTKFLNLLN